MGQLATASSFATLGYMLSFPTCDPPNTISCMKRCIFSGETDGFCSLHHSKNIHRCCKMFVKSLPARTLLSTNVSNCIKVVRSCNTLPVILQNHSGVFAMPMGIWV